jgi:SAM-dependent methyltransferase
MIYENYAAVYDMSGQAHFSVLMAHYLDDIVQRHPVSGTHALDMACGTGVLLVLLAERGWQVVGLDASPAMLGWAQQKFDNNPLAERISLVQGDMRALQQHLAPEQFGLVTCVYDSLNYLLSEEDMAACFAGLASRLAPGGLFVGDINTRYFLEYDWETFAIHEQPGYIELGTSVFDPQQATSSMHVTGFAGNDTDGYVRFDETHIEKAFSSETMVRLFTAAGLVVEAAYDCFTFRPPHARTQRVAWIVRKPEHPGT